MGKEEQAKPADGKPKVARGQWSWVVLQAEQARPTKNSMTPTIGGVGQASEEEMKAKKSRGVRLQAKRHHQ